jgi:hypothetical protein
MYHTLLFYNTCCILLTLILAMWDSNNIGPELSFFTANIRCDGILLVTMQSCWIYFTDIDCLLWLELNCLNLKNERNEHSNELSGEALQRRWNWKDWLSIFQMSDWSFDVSNCHSAWCFECCKCLFLVYAFC